MRPSPRLLLLLILCATSAWAAPAPQITPVLPPPPEDVATSEQYLATAKKEATEKDWQDALRDIDIGITLNQKNSDAYQLRANFYVQQQLWDRAEEDYTTAIKLHPTPTLSYDLAEIMFMEHSYDKARLGFSHLIYDKEFGDISLYKMLLCDVLNRDNAAVSADETILDTTRADHPVYMFGHAVLDLFHNNREGGAYWLHQAEENYNPQVYELFMTSLKESRKTHLNKLTFTTKSGKTFNDQIAFVESDGIRTIEDNQWVTIPFSDLPDDKSVFPADVQGDIKIYQIPGPVPDALPHITEDAPTIKREYFSFTTKEKKTYNQVWGFADSDGVRILTQDGWIHVPIADLPQNLAVFPADMRAQLEDARSRPPAPKPDITSIIPNFEPQDTRATFDTKDGQHYDQVHIFAEDTELRVLTENGWITVPYSQLKGSLKGFPADMRPTISKNMASAPSNDHAKS